ncbi:hypothetical protein BHE74_00037406 [Ensete ventricosum]|nr:hypothetical protein BHE74_00037406 [Ensete ventricosum]RZR98107.1 hypothetical protein BHM03_00027413 [Ensete ventricosum]
MVVHCRWLGDRRREGKGPTISGEKGWTRRSLLKDQERVSSMVGVAIVVIDGGTRDGNVGCSTIEGHGGGVRVEGELGIGGGGPMLAEEEEDNKAGDSDGGEGFKKGQQPGRAEHSRATEAKTGF